MNFIEIPVDHKKIGSNKKDLEVIETVKACRRTAAKLMEENRELEALEREIEALRTLRNFSDFDNVEFRAMLATLLFDLSEIHYTLKDYKQSEKELEVLFRVLENLLKHESDRFGQYHVMAMDLSTRILRSRKKTLDMLVKQQLNAGALYDKVNSGVVAAIDRLVESLRSIGEMLASTGDYRAALKFYTEAIRLSKKRTGRVARREIAMSIEMAKVMMRIRPMRPRARRLLEAVLPAAIAQETVELEEDIHALFELLNKDMEQEPKWRTFLVKLQQETKRLSDARKQKAEERKEKKAEKEALKAEKKAAKEAKKAEKAMKQAEKETKKAQHDLKKDKTQKAVKETAEALKETAKAQDSEARLESEIKKAEMDLEKLEAEETKLDGEKK